MKKDILYDQYRLTGKWSNHVSLRLLLLNRVFRRLYYYRKLRHSTGFVFIMFQCLNQMLHRKMSLEIPRSVKLGKGVLLLHPYSITFNSGCEIGENFTICKGATIGNSKTKKAGAPIIGDNVYVGLNAVIVGGVKIGSNVLIAPNAFVNFDVPNDSVVIGNPGQIHHKERAAEPYIVNSIWNV